MKVRTLSISDFLALFFGMVVILIIFGDNRPVPYVGNLDVIFGRGLWPFMDVIYPAASIALFLFYGRSKGPLKLEPGSIWPFLIFLAAALMIQIDDIFQALRHPVVLPDSYWTAAKWLYFIMAVSTFLVFGAICAQNKRQTRN
jgi:hypothetical protein